LRRRKKNGGSDLNKIYVVGIGPGAYEQMTVKAAEILKKCDVIVGYTVYAELLKEYFPDKEFLTTPMQKEIERCRMAFEEAKNGKKTAMVCSGDAGIYGMAGLMLELSADYPDIKIEVVPGVTAALGGSAVLGAPLGHDCAFVSLSDLMTSWEVIEKRLLAAAKADFIICLYNPSSRKRSDYLRRACDIVLKEKSPDTVCGIVRNIARSKEEMKVMTLEELKSSQVDMFSTVFIGNKDTKVIEGRMVTPRGYRIDRFRI
jgi:precorrin-3B C17-methyltransferase